VARADALLFVTPEYNRSVPGVLKNAIDWISRPPEQPFADKPVAIMGASRGRLGTIMANHHLRQILAYLGAQILTGPEVLVGEAGSKFDAQGELTDGPTRDFVQAHLQKLCRLTRLLQAEPL
jgi:chromate reductase